MNISTPRTAISQIWLQDGSLARCEAPYKGWLNERGYTASTARNYLQCLVHFASWATDRRLAPENLSAKLIRRFVDDHLPRCNCCGRVQRCRTQVRAALAQLLPALNAAGIACVTEAPNAMERELNRFDAYLRDQRGLSASTRLQRRKILSGLLTLSSRANGQPAWQDATRLRRYTRACLQRWSPASGAVLVGSLRSYLRYRASLGDEVTALLPVLASPAVWHLAGLPQTLTRAEVECVLNSFDASLPSWRRGRAVAHCVARLGLRSAEVVTLELEDLDWSAGTIRLRGCKSRRVDVMPMPASVGHTIVEYLQHERPACQSRKVFVRHKAPVEEPLLPGLVKRVVLARIIHV